ncbi:MAG TPA: cold shock and DUF1294 domain-containing protein [Rubrivivax sp.]|nr:cold shock and DUF1294 domain-containing protein [Rubrivivax sp.]
MKDPSTPMRFEGILGSWNDDRGFGCIESTQGGQPIFVHVSAWPRGSGRPQVKQAVSFEVESGPKGKRAKNVQLARARRVARQAHRSGPAQWGVATLLAIPAFLAVFAAVAVLWKPPLWVAGLYVAASVVTFVAYAADKSAAASGAWRTRERTLHLMALAGGWPGALLAQQLLRHKSTKQPFRQVFWATVVLNVMALLALVCPAGRNVLDAL